MTIPYVLKFMSSTLVAHLPLFGWYFSLFLAGLLGFSLLKYKDTTVAAKNFFFWQTLSLLLLMLTIAGTRMVFTPDTWMLIRYQPVAVLFATCIGIHGYIVAHQLIAPWCKLLVFGHVFIALCLVQHFNFYDQFSQSNKIFRAHAQMLAFGANQDNGDILKLWSRKSFDPIAENDEFYKQNGYAWYHNKQNNNSTIPVTLKPGEKFLDPQTLEELSGHCRRSGGKPEFSPNKEYQAYNFSQTLPWPEFRWFNTLVARNTYYTLDDLGYVVGFAWLEADSSQHFRPTLKGISTSRNVRYITEVREQPRCLMVVDQP
jgi:hypothetical protein